MLGAQASRHLTGRRLLLMARGGYHGSYDDLEFGATDSLSPFPPPFGRNRAKGIKRGERTLLADFGDAEGFERILSERGAEIAAVFVEPVLGAGGVIAPPSDFLKRVAEAARRAG